MRKHKKIYYVSGLISALLVPLLFLYYAAPVYNQMDLRVITLGLPAKSKKGEKISEYTKIPTEGWSYKTINVAPHFDKKTEEFFIREINQLKKSNVDQTGIRFQLSNNNKYADIVGLLNIMLKTEQEIYGFDMDETNSFYLLHKKHPEKADYVTCGTGYMTYINMEQYNYANADFWNKLINYSPRQSYYLIFGFLMLIYCTMLKPKLIVNF